MIVVNSQLTIPDDELQFTFARSGGPGGQNVNKVNSKALLRWNVVSSSALPEDLKTRFVAKYRHRLTREGDLLVTSQRYRDQPKNVEDCCQKVAEMLREVFVAPKRRRATKPTRGSRVRRLNDKRQHATKKDGRKKSHPAD